MSVRKSDNGQGLGRAEGLRVPSFDHHRAQPMRGENNLRLLFRADPGKNIG